MNVYQRVLQDRVTLLHGNLRRFFTSEPPLRATGRLRVTRATGWLRRVFLSLTNLPPGGEHDVRVEVQAHGDAQKWVRSFGQHVFATVHSDYRGLLVESAGPMSFGFELAVEDASLNFVMRQAWFCGIPLPGFCRPNIEARNIADDTGWRVEVRMRLPVLGLVIQYEGHVAQTD
jgi:hypothetical protein